MTTPPRATTTTTAATTAIALTRNDNGILYYYDPTSTSTERVHRRRRRRLCNTSQNPKEANGLQQRPTGMTTTRASGAIDNKSNPNAKNKKKNVWQHLSCLWKAPIGCEDDDDEEVIVEWSHCGKASSSISPPHNNDNNTNNYYSAYNSIPTMKPQASASTFIMGNDEDDEDEEDAGVVEEFYEDDMVPENFHHLQFNDDNNNDHVLSNDDDDWTERANAYYAAGHAYAAEGNLEAATRAFCAEAALLQVHGAAASVVASIYSSCARLWTVRQPSRALGFYQHALTLLSSEHENTTTTTTEDKNIKEERQAIQHAMGRLYFQTGNLEQAMQHVTCTLPK